MDNKRTEMRERVLYGGLTTTRRGETRNCVIRDMSKGGAKIAVDNRRIEDNDEVLVIIPRKGCKLRGRVAWRGDNIIGVQFLSDHQDSLAEQLRTSERRRRVMLRQMSQLIGGD